MVQGCRDTSKEHAVGNILTPLPAQTANSGKNLACTRSEAGVVHKHGLSPLPKAAMGISGDPLHPWCAFVPRNMVSHTINEPGS